MNKSLKIILMLLIVSLFSTVAFAQDDETSIYADIPMSRTEDGAFVLGNPDAPVKMIEFADFLCPHCQDYKATISEFITQYVATGQAQLEYRMLPVVDPRLSAYTADLVQCADILAEGTFWEAHDLMYELASTAPISPEAITQFADTLGLEEDALNACTPTAGQYEIDSNFAQDLGITGTPTVAMQYGDSDPVVIALPAPSQFDLLINANRPTSTEPVIIETGRYTGIQTYRSEDGGFVIGSPDAPITIVAFEDFMCPHCQNYQPTVHTLIEDYVKTGQAKFEYRFFPIVSPEYSMLTSQIAECVGMQDIGKFWEAHDLLFEFAASNEIDEEIASVIAMLVGEDTTVIENCVDTALQPMVDINLGQDVGVTGTPGIRVRGEDGVLQLIYAGQQPLQRGAVPLEALVALIEGSEELSIGQPEITLLNDNLLVDDSLITGEPCEAPCWQNITPGETSLADARTIVEQLDNTSIQDSENSFAFTFDTSMACCQIASQDNETVSTILLQLAPTNSLGSVIEANGEPSFVSGELFSETESIITLFYTEISALIYTVVDGENGQLSEETPVFTVIYVTPDLMERLVATTPLDNWKGYLTYNEYMDGEFDYNG